MYERGPSSNLPRSHAVSNLLRALRRHSDDPSAVGWHPHATAVNHPRARGCWPASPFRPVFPYLPPRALLRSPGTAVPRPAAGVLQLRLAFILGTTAPFRSACNLCGATNYS